MKKILIPLTILLLIAIGFLVWKSNLLSSLFERWTTYESQEYGFKVKHPLNMAVKDDENLGTITFCGGDYSEYCGIWGAAPHSEIYLFKLYKSGYRYLYSFLFQGGSLSSDLWPFGENPDDCLVNDINIDGENGKLYECGDSLHAFWEGKDDFFYNMNVNNLDLFPKLNEVFRRILYSFEFSDNEASLFQDDEAANWEIYDNDEYGFRISFPDNYEVSELVWGGIGTGITSSDPPATIMFNVDELESPLKRDNWESITVNGMKGLKSPISENMDGGKEYVIAIPLGDLMYSILFSTDAPGEEEEFRTFEEILSTFKFYEEDEFTIHEINSSLTPNFIFEYPNDWQIKEQYIYESAACQADLECFGVHYLFLNKKDDNRSAALGEKEGFGIAINLPQCTGTMHDALPGENWICAFSDDSDTASAYEGIRNSFRLQ